MKLALILSLAIAPSWAASEWTRYIAPDEGFSLHYPTGWMAEPSDGALVLRSEETSEVVLLLVLPSSTGETARGCAEVAIAALGEQGWQLEPRGWRPEEPDANPVALHFGGRVGGGAVEGDCLTQLEDDGVLWLGYLRPEADYEEPRAFSILQGIAGSLTEGGDSQPPRVRIRGGRADGLARAFVFVLEFALGEPLAAEEEGAVIDALLEGADLDALAAYPELVRAILGADRERLVGLQEELATATREWLEESDPADPCVRLVREHLESAGRSAAEGDPPLTARQADAYAEMVTYGAALGASPLALPEEIEAEARDALREALVEAWPGLSAEERAQVAEAPAVWTCLRSVLEHGNAEQQAQARAALAGLGAEQSEAGAVEEGTPNAGGDSAVDRMLRSQVMLNLNQMTFDHYMWSRGLAQTPFGW